MPKDSQNETSVGKLIWARITRISNLKRTRKSKTSPANQSAFRQSLRNCDCRYNSTHQRRVLWNFKKALDFFVTLSAKFNNFTKKYYNLPGFSEIRGRKRRESKSLNL
jgi:hypothetical protein